MKRIKKGVVLGGFLMVFLGLFYSARAQDTLLSLTPKRPPDGQRPQGQTMEERGEEMTLQVNLSERQSQKITEILTKGRLKISELIEKVAEDIRAAKKRTEAEVKAAMTKEQWLKYNPPSEPQEEDDEDTILKVFGRTD